jgi:proline iminopeptidase
MTIPRWLFPLPLALLGCMDPSAPGNLVPKTAAEDPTLPHIELAGTKLHAQAMGAATAPLVIVLHGGPGSDYRGMLALQKLADEGYRVVFWDQRGAGLSQRHAADSYSLPQYLEDLRLLVEYYTATPGQPLVFIGHSWGAMYATWFINDYGDYGGRVQGAILSEPGAFTKAQLDAFLVRYQASIALTGEALNDGLWARQFISATDQAQADYLWGQLSFRLPPSAHNDPNNPIPFWRVGAVVNTKLTSLAEEGFDWTTNLAAFHHKVMFLRGDLNTAATLASQQEMAASYPDAEIVTMVNVGHEMLWERPDEYLTHVRAYFAKIGFAGVSP